MDWPTFPKPTPAKKRPNRTVSTDRRRRYQQKDRERRKVYAVVDARDCHVCRHCGGDGQHHHHVVFRSQGGLDTTENIVTLCASCHDRIHARTLFVTGNADGLLTFTKERL